MVVMAFGLWFIRVDTMTLVLSVFSIVQGSTILVSQRHSEQSAHRRDVALHAKMDGLIAAIDKADNALIGIEVVEDEI